MTVMGSPEQAETALPEGEIPCPHCSALLRPQGHARHRIVRGLGQERLTVQPRRARCADCGRTQVLLPASLSLRRADTVEAIGTALAAKAAGSWPPPDRCPAGPDPLHDAAMVEPGTGEHAHWIYAQSVKHAYRLNHDMLFRPKQWPSLLGWSLNILAGAALAYNHRASAELPPWTAIGYFTRGNLLSPLLRT